MTETGPKFDWQRSGYRKVDIGAVIVNSFAMVRRLFVPMLILGFVFVVLPGLAMVYSGEIALPFSGAARPEITMWVVNFGAMALQSIFGVAILVQLCLDNHKGVRIGLLSPLRSVFSRTWPLVAASVVAGLAVMLGLLFLIVPGVILYCGWFVVFPIILEEDCGPIQSMERSWALTQGHKGPVFGLILILFALAMAMGVLSEVLGSLATSEETSGSNTLSLANFISVILIGAGTLLANMISAAFIVQTYAELRRIKEGLDQHSIGEIFD